jgi:phosphinothricin acetyltransferase
VGLVVCTISFYFSFFFFCREVCMHEWETWLGESACGGWLRWAEERDVEAMLSIYRPYIDGSAVSFELDVPSREAFWSRVSKTLERFPWIVLERDGLICGYAYASAHRSRKAYQWATESSVYVAPEARRQGVARTLYEALFGLLAAQGFVTVYSGITMPNDASVAFHQSMGFVHVGTYHNVGFKCGQWHDVSWLEKELQTLPKEPVEPVSLADWLKM